MPKNLTDVSTFTDPIVVPVGGDQRNAESVEVGFQGLANRTKYLSDLLTNGVIRIRQAADTAAVRALTSHSSGDVLVVADGRFYEYSTTVNVIDDGVLILKPNDIAGGTPGRWVNPARAILSASGITFSGSITFGGLVDFNDNVDFAADVQIAGTLDAADVDCATLDASGAMTSASLVTTGDVTVGDDLSVTGDASVGGNLVATGSITAGTLVSTPSLSSPTSTTLGGTTTISGTANVNGTTNFSLTTNFNGTTNLNGSTALTSPMTLSSDGTIRYRVVTGANADTTYNVADYDIIISNSLTGNRTYTIGSSGAVAGAKITFNNRTGFQVEIDSGDPFHDMVLVSGGYEEASYVYHSGSWHLLSASKFS